MKKAKKSSQGSAYRIIGTSFVVAILSHLMIWATVGRKAPLLMSSWPDAPSYVITLLAVLPSVLCLVIIGIVAYLLVRRKIAAIAAVPAALLISSLSSATLLTPGNIAVLGVSLVGMVSTVIFYGFYLLLSRSSRPQFAASILIFGMLIVSFAVSTAVLYAMRLSY